MSPRPPKDKQRKPAGKSPSKHRQERRERLQKIMATAGLGSRRALEKRIAAGEIRINGELARLGDTATFGDIIRLDGDTWKVSPMKPLHRCLVYNKPEGEVTTRSDPQGRPTVFDTMPRLKGARWIAVGRLDINTTGLLLMTTDGELAHALMHPSNKVDREYAVRVRAPVEPEALQNMKKGVELDDGPANFSDIVASGGSDGNLWFHVTIMEGRNREVRRLWASQGIRVSRLKRVRYGAVFLPKRLHMGKFSELSPGDYQILREDVGLPAPEVSMVLRPEKRRGKKR